MEYKLYLKNNIKKTNIDNNDTILNLLLEKYLEKFTIDTTDVSNNFFKLITNYNKILFIGGSISEPHIRNLLLRNNNSYFLTLSRYIKDRNNYIGKVMSNYNFTTTFVTYANTIDKIYIDGSTAKFFENEDNVPDIGLNHGVVYNLLYSLKIGGCLYIPKEDIKLDYIKKCTDKKSPKGNRAFNIIKINGIDIDNGIHTLYKIKDTDLFYYEYNFERVKVICDNGRFTDIQKNTNIETINKLLFILYGVTSEYIGNIFVNYKYKNDKYIKYTKTKDI